MAERDLRSLLPSDVDDKIDTIISWCNTYCIRRQLINETRPEQYSRKRCGRRANRNGTPVNPVKSNTDAVAQSHVTQDGIEILLIDDNMTWVRTQRRVLDRQTDEITATTAHSLSEARVRLASSTPDCIVCDYQLGDGTGLELLMEIRNRIPELPFILVTGQGDEAVASDAISEQVTDYVRKSDLGSQPALLFHRIEAVVDTYRTKRVLAHERRSKEALLGIVTTNTTRHELGRNICRHLIEE